MSKTKNTIYNTSDLALAAVLSIYYPIEEIDRTNPGRVNFIFTRTDKLDSLLTEYWKKELKIEPQLYYQQIKAIKTRLYSENY